MSEGFMTERLRMRRWVAADLDPLVEMSNDERVMEHFPSLMTRAQCELMMSLVNQELEERGFGLWGLERRDTGAFIGYTGLHEVSFDTSFTPAIEVGWRLAYDAWGQGFATEAARRALEIGFQAHALPEIVSFTIPENVRSQAVMRRLGMRRDKAGDFDHPRHLDDDRIRRHILYRLTVGEWESQLLEA